MLELFTGPILQEMKEHLDRLLLRLQPLKHAAKRFEEP
jgi:hypothetical protein